MLKLRFNIGAVGVEIYGEGIGRSTEKAFIADVVTNAQIVAGLLAELGVGGDGASVAAEASKPGRPKKKNSDAATAPAPAANAIQEVGTWGAPGATPPTAANPVTTAMPQPPAPQMPTAAGLAFGAPVNPTSPAPAFAAPGLAPIPGAEQAQTIAPAFQLPALGPALGAAPAMQSAPVALNNAAQLSELSGLVNSYKAAYPQAVAVIDGRFLQAIGQTVGVNTDAGNAFALLGQCPGEVVTKVKDAFLTLLQTQ